VNFPFNLYLAAFASPLVLTLLTVPLWRRWCVRTGLVDDPGRRKIHDAPVPLAGGLAVLSGMLLPLAVAAVLIKIDDLGFTGSAQIAHGLSRRTIQLAAIAIGAVGITVLGWLDDKHELKPLPKFAGQLLMAALVAAAGTRITLFVDNTVFQFVDKTVFSYSITLLWLLTVINAFNFMDNMNGLCGGLGVIGAFYFAVAAAVAGQYLVAIIGLMICGALLGFLPYNFPRAGAFLGDAGSHLVGYLLAVLAILPHFYTASHPRRWAVLTPLLVLAIPLGDLVWVVLLRWRLGKPFYVGDTNHLSHRLARLGLSRTTAVLLIWLLAAIIGALAFV
jgi:UDP-GlcNAc:undecaprenyl-phosphate/decaprenyl-phosphate GlcNAc-1-phosphate transferase